MSKASREQIIEFAREWRGTPHVHQQSIKGEAADCEGFVEGVFKEAGHAEVVGIVHNYRRREDGSLMLALLQANLDFIVGNPERKPIDMSLALPADLLAFCDPSLREPNAPTHLGIYTGQRNGRHCIIHSGSIDHGVVEHGMNQAWLKRTHSIWRVRGIDG